MTVVQRNFATKKEVTTMTTTTIDGRFARRHTPSLFDRLVMRISLTTLMWARHHSDRAAVSHEEHAMRMAAMRDLERTRHESLQFVSRLR
jgi:hypothetical protein